MSPTLLEATVAILLLWLAWQIGLRIAPYVIRYFIKNFRVRAPQDLSERAEKNITPPSEFPDPSHGHSTK